jgi:hypothetical protein
MEVEIDLTIENEMHAFKCLDQIYVLMHLGALYP